MKEEKGGRLGGKKPFVKNKGVTSTLGVSLSHKLLGEKLVCIPCLLASVGCCQKPGCWTGWASDLTQYRCSCLLSKAIFLPRLFPNTGEEHNLFNVLPSSAFQSKY